MRYSVTIADFAPGRSNIHRVHALTLAQAWRVAVRHARRGVKLYGGKVTRDNWGTRGGDVDMRAYRATTIRVDAR
jgi:hypothetical protein